MTASHRASQWLTTRSAVTQQVPVGLSRPAAVFVVRPGPEHLDHSQTLTNDKPVANRAVSNATHTREYLLADLNDTP